MTAFFSSLMPLYPELLLAGGALLIVVLGAYGGERTVHLINTLAIALMAAAIALIAVQPNEAMAAFNGSFRIEAFGRFLKILTLIGSIGAIVLAWRYQRQEGYERFEFAILVTLATLGMMVLISAGDLIALYLGLELQSLALYVIAAMHRDNARSSEAGLKYFVLGALSSGMLLYGCSFIYGYTGTVSFEGIAAALTGADVSMGLVFGLVFLLAGLAFKISAVPFHMWTPDVYEGAPTPVTAFFAAAPKVAGMAILIRVLFEAFPDIVPQWQQIIVFVSIASMVLGSFAAIGQRNIKRLMAYSSIGHVGYALVGLAAATPQGVQGVLVYLAIYVAMTLGTFACILAMRTDKGQLEDIHDLSGLARTNPVLGFVLVALLFSLAGIPPLAGFFAKFYVFLAAVNGGLYALAVIGVVASVIGAYYYLRLIKIICFDEPVVSFKPMPWEVKSVLVVSSLFVVLYILAPTLLDGVSATAAASLFPGV
jgi:NADH-quinone oxidoreductase subunit N